MQRADMARHVQHLLSQQDFLQALALAEQWSHKQPHVPGAWLAVARAALGLGLLGRSDEAMTRAFSMIPTDPEAQFFRSVIDHRIGRSDQAIERLRPLTRMKHPIAVDASLALADALHRTARHDDLSELVRAGGAWISDDRAVLSISRVLAQQDPAAAMARLEGFARSSAPAWLRRFAGFDAVRMLDAHGEFRRAFDLAAHVHATTDSRFDVKGLELEVQRQRTLLNRERGWCPPRAAAVTGVSLVVSLPRSGTTLLEQMLDRHPHVTGIGEYDGMMNLGDDLVGTGLWPDRLAQLSPEHAAAFQNRYLQGARSFMRPNTTHFFDKMLLTWLWLPAVASVLPGASCFHMARDPRDSAVSLFLSNFHPQTMGWTRSLAEIQRVFTAERSLLPEALQTLGLNHETIVYEHLVAHPADTLNRCLQKMGLAMDPAVLQPEHNTRTVHTLSHEQVRKPIHAGSIGRWRNYEWAFDASWKPLVDHHDQRRAAAT